MAFTGGPERVETALRLLAEGRADRLLLSGIGGGAELPELAHRAGVDPLPLAARVTIGRSATTTRGNAAETAAWARANEIHSLLVVTASYHMPRAMTELARHCRRRSSIPCRCVPPERADRPAVPLRLMAEEYIKFLADDGRADVRCCRNAKPPAHAAMPDDVAALGSVQPVLLRGDLRDDPGAGHAGPARGTRIACSTWRGCGRASCCGRPRVICGIRLQVSGLERVGSGAALIASRHQSAFDTLVWLTLVPRCCYVLKRELLRIPLFGPLLPLAGMIAVDRDGGAAALRGLMREGERAEREGRQIVIFPEGTRAAPGSLLPLQPGVAALAARIATAGHPRGDRFGPSAGAAGRSTSVPAPIHIRLLEPIPAGTAREQLMARLEAALRREVVENSVG